jgi:NADH:ubiquinone oxidoreductase subunit 2 (subunit N)
VLESALKYFLIGSVTSILTLIGIFFVLISFKSVFFFEILNNFSSFNYFFLIMPFYFFFSIIFFKLGIFPFNF